MGRSDLHIGTVKANTTREVWEGVGWGRVRGEGEGVEGMSGSVGGGGDKWECEEGVGPTLKNTDHETKLLLLLTTNNLCAHSHICVSLHFILFYMQSRIIGTYLYSLFYFTIAYP